MTPPFPERVVALFVRPPVPGRVKTRLAREIGGERACLLYAAMAEDALRNASEDFPVALFHDGAGAAALPPSWLRMAAFAFPQEGNDLGERMACAFRRLLAEGAERVALAGSDVPGLDAELFRCAFDVLDEVDGALSPSFDGGYCLVAFRREGFHRRPFEGIPWSTERVLDLTLEAFAECGRTAALLSPRRDVDTLDSLRAYCLDPAPGAASTNRWLREEGFLPHGETRPPSRGEPCPRGDGTKGAPSSRGR